MATPGSDNPLLTQFQTRVASLETEVGEIRGAVKGSYGNPGLADRVTRIEARQDEIKSMLSAVQAQQDVNMAQQKDRDQRRDEEQQRRDKRMNMYLTAVLSLMVTVLGGLILTALNSGLHP